MVRRGKLPRDMDADAQDIEDLPEMPESRRSSKFHDVVAPKKFRELAKDYSFRYDRSRGRIIEREAARRGCAVADLIRAWIDPHVDALSQ